MRPARRFPDPTAFYRLCWTLFVLSALGYIAAAGAQLPHYASEQAVKATFLYKFPDYVEWPHPNGRPLAVGVLGADDVAHALARLAAASPPGARQLTVQRIREADAALEFDMLYIGRGVRYPLDVLLRRAQQRGVLTVTESEEAFARGSVINFKLVEGRVRFDVSLAAAERSNLRLSSRLLAVAHQVQRENF